VEYVEIRAGGVEQIAFDFEEHRKNDGGIVRWPGRPGMGANSHTARYLPRWLLDGFWVSGAVGVLVGDTAYIET
jgi:hypothetical protein